MDMYLIKKLAREEARRARQQLFDKAGPDVPERLSHFASKALADKAPAIVAGYLPIRSEIDPRMAQADLVRRGWSLALPCVEDEDGAMSFRLWEMGEPLVQGAFQTEMPAHDAEMARPDVVLVPMLAFDVAGYRLGYGGGYYDRALDALRSGGDVRVIGLAFAGQLVKSVPKEDHDQPLDMIITEKGIWLPGATDFRNSL